MRSNYSTAEKRDQPSLAITITSCREVVLSVNFVANLFELAPRSLIHENSSFVFSDHGGFFIGGSTIEGECINRLKVYSDDDNNHHNYYNTVNLN